MRGLVLGLALACAGLAASQVPARVLATVSTPAPKLSLVSQTKPGEQQGIQIVSADERLEIVPPTSPFRLGVPNRLQIRIHGVGLKKIYSLQSGYDDETRTKNYSIDEEGSVNPVEVENGATFIEVVPLTLGKDNVLLAARFEDRAVTTGEVQVEVVPPGVSAELSVRDSGSGKLLLTLPRKGNEAVRQYLYLEASYPGVKQEILIDHRYVKYQVIDGKGMPSVSVNPVTATITPLVRGHSLLSMSFDGNTALTCVIVQDPDQDVPDRSHCEDLLRPGEKLAGNGISWGH